MERACADGKQVTAYFLFFQNNSFLLNIFIQYRFFCLSQEASVFRYHISQRPLHQVQSAGRNDAIGCEKRFLR
jgi:hypothetical protein